MSPACSVLRFCNFSQPFVFCDRRLPAHPRYVVLGGKGRTLSSLCLDDPTPWQACEILDTTYLHPSWKDATIWRGGELQTHLLALVHQTGAPTLTLALHPSSTSPILMAEQTQGERIIVGHTPWTRDLIDQGLRFGFLQPVAMQLQWRKPPPAQIFG